MSSQEIPESDTLKLIYQEIIEGCSYYSKGYFIKHLCELEQIELTRKRIEFVQSYIKAGIPTEDERLAQIKSEGEWSDTKDEDMKAYRQTIADTEKTLLSVIPQQQASIKKILKEHKDTLIKLIIEKKFLLGTTAEDLSERDCTYFFGYLSLYTDRSCKTRLFKSWEEFESLPEQESLSYINSIDTVLAKLTEQNIRKIGSLPFFLNSFSYCREAIHTFLDKPVCELTNYQVHLFSAGSRNLNILSQSEGSPPEYFGKTTADEVLRWYDTQYSIIIGKRKM